MQFITVAGFSASIAYFALYLHAERGVPMGTVGLVVMVAALGSAPVQLLTGRASDRLGRRPFLSVPLLARAIVFFVMSGLVTVRAHYLLLGLGLLLARALGAVFLAAAEAMLADVTKPEDRVEGYSLVRVGGNLGWSAGPALGGLIAERSYPLVFALTGVSSLVGAALAWRGLSESWRSAGPRAEGQALSDLTQAWRDRAFLLLCLGSLALFTIMGQMIVPLSVFSVEWVGLSKLQYGYLCSINGLMVVLLQHPVATLIRNRNEGSLLVGSSLIFGLGYLAMAWGESFGCLAWCMAVITLAEILFAPTSVTLASRLAPPGARGSYLAAFGLVRIVGWGVSPSLGGILMGRFPGRPLPVWGTIGGMAAIPAILFAIGHRAFSRRATPAPEGAGQSMGGAPEDLHAGTADPLRPLPPPD